jgi:hypothetical protein
MPTNQVTRRWPKRRSGNALWLLIVGCVSLTTLISLAPGSARAQRLDISASSSLQVAHLPLSTPDPGSPAVHLTPNSGPVGTMISIQGNGWPAGSTIQIQYSQTSCTSPSAQEIPNDPKPKVDSSGNFSAQFPWPAVSSIGFWAVCALTSDDAATGSALFNVLSTTAPSVSIASGTLMLGQTITIQGQNWLPGGLTIAVALQLLSSGVSYSLDGYAVSLVNGTLDPQSASFLIPSGFPAGRYTLVASAEQEALQAQTAPFTIAPQPTPTATPAPSPSPTPDPSPTSTPTHPPAHHQTPPSSHRQLGGTLLALLIISGGMTLLFALVGTVLLIYLVRSRQSVLAKEIPEQYTEPLSTTSTS